jgi:hypothetical protein
MVEHYIVDAFDGINFCNSSKKCIWTIRRQNKKIINSINHGDRLWFVQYKKSDINYGKIVAVATFVSNSDRCVGPLIATTLTNDELGFDNKGHDDDIQINYTDLYNLSQCKFYTHKKRHPLISNYANYKYDNIQLQLNLDFIYENVVMYSNITRCM